MATIEKSIDVGVPVSVAYDQWTQFEEFPQFMDGIVEVKQLDDTHLHWVADIDGERKEWKGAAHRLKVRRVGDGNNFRSGAAQPSSGRIRSGAAARRRAVAWRSVEGLENSGRVEFEPIDSGTRVSVAMQYDAEGVKESLGALFGVDGRQVANDLESFRELVEAREVPTGAWRGTVESGDVVDNDPAR